MKKNYFRIAFLLLFLSLSAKKLYAQYCTPSFNDPSQLYISRVTLNTLDYSQTYVSSSNSYSDLTAFSTSLNIGDTYTMSIYTNKANTSYSPGYGIWIDYNNDGDFSDSNEEIQILSSNTTSPRSFSFTVPDEVTLGDKRMRINMVNWYSPWDCITDPSNSGETEDYTITITPPLNPVAIDDNLTVLKNSTSGVSNQITVGTNDYIGTSDGTDGDDFSLTSASPTTNGGTIIEVSDGVFEYVPASDFLGSDTFTYTICDANGDCDSATVNVKVSFGECTPTSSSSGAYYITNVNIPGETYTLNNTSGDDGGYGDYTSTVPAVDFYKGSSYTATISITTEAWASNSMGWSLYIDLNGNGDFTDTGEMLYNTNGTGGTETTPFASQSITIPTTALTGLTIMRIGTRRYWSSTSPCGNPGSEPEEFEDYLVNIQLDPTAPPNISVAGNSNNITNGSVTPENANLTSFGIQDPTSGVKSRTYTITNTSSLDLILGAIPVSLTGSSEFTISSQPAANTVITTGNSVSFTIAFDPNSIGSFSASVQISSNDPDDNPFTFLIAGDGVQIYKDTDGDGITDNIDIDDDNDGIEDSVEQLGCISNPLASLVETEFLFEDFGSGTNRIKINGETAGVTTSYCYEDGSTAQGVDECDTDPNLTDGKYTVNYSITDGTNTITSTGPNIASWAYTVWTQTTEDHTPGDTNGRMAIFNASYTPGVFYETQITGVLPGVPITYSFWAMNIMNTETGTILPNITVNFYSTDYSTLLDSYDTGDISRCTTSGCIESEWQNFSVSTVLPVNEFVIQFVNNAPGGYGNDLALDDIQITQTLCDSDGDGIADILDLDNDNDGIPNIIEAAMITNPDPDQDSTTAGASWVDTNSNGMHDTFEGLVANDFDGDGVPNYLDLDSDNDTVFDVLEFDGQGDLDISGDGIGDGSDVSINGIDNDELDDDGILGLADSNDSDSDANDYGTTGYLGAIDSDSDGTPDYLDVFNNISGVFNIDTTIYSNLDANNDGIIDDTTDADNDGIMDSFDTLDANYGSPRDLNNSYSLYFDGRNDYVEDTNVIASGDATFMAFIKSDGANTLSTDRIVVGQDNYSIRINTDNTVSVLLNGSTIITSTTVIPNSIWVHLATTTTSGETILYINGKNEGTSTSGSITTDTSNFTIGKLSSTDSNYFKGELEEVRVFNVALTADEVKRMVYQELDESNSFNRGKIIPTDISASIGSQLVRYYKMDTYNDDVLDDKTTPSIDVSGAKIYNIKDIYFQTAPLPYETVADGNWTTTGSWLHGDVWDIMSKQNNPDEASIVHIKNNINLNGSYDTQGMVGLIVDSGKEFSIEADKELYNSWYLKLDGLIDLDNESQLVQTEGSVLDVSSSGTLERDQQGTKDLYTYNFWCSPVGPSNTTSNNNSYTVPDILNDGSITTTPVTINFLTSGYNGDPGNPGVTPISIADYWIWKYANKISDTYSKWQHIRSTNPILAGEGFTMKGVESSGSSFTSTQNYTFNGKPNNGDITLPLASGNEYLVGNPYPSAIDANEFILDNIGDGSGRAASNVINGALYFWDHFANDTHILKEYEGGYATYTLIGATKARSNDTRINASGIYGTKTPQQYIPVAQGFFVSSVLDPSLTDDGLTSPVTGGNITFKNSQRIFKTEASDPSLFIKSSSNVKSISNTAKTNTDTRQKIWLMLDSPEGYHRQLLVGVDKNASSSFDIGYDAPLIEDNNEDMFWLFNNNNFIIQGVNNFDSEQKLPLGVKVHTNGLATIKIDTLENISNGLNIYLHDKTLDIYHDLKESDYIVNLTPGEYLDRFEITFNSKLLSNETQEQENSFFTYYDDSLNNIIISNPKKQTIDTIQIINMVGQIVLEKDLNTSKSNIEIPLSIQTGAYILKISANGFNQNKKILINQ